MADLERRVADVERWIVEATPAVTDLIWDHAIRERRERERDHAWKRFGVRVAVAGGVIGITSGLVVVGERIVEGLHLLGLP